MAKRQDKYPDTKIFTYHNQNPHNRITGDCVARAISFALDLPYNKVIMDMAEFQCKTGFDASYNEERFLETAYGIHKQASLRHDDNTRYTVKEFIERFPKGTYILRMPSHLTAVKDGKNYDIWDCTKSSNKVGNYWVIK